jgi:hypothetical protein
MNPRMNPRSKKKSKSKGTGARRAVRKEGKVPELDGLKREAFFAFLQEAGRVFILVRDSGKAKIGRRGFLPEERENGMVLVFNRSMNFTWDDSGIHATLILGSVPEKCYIPPEDIVAVYSPELGAQLVVSPEGTAAGAKTEEADANVIKVDFRRKR